MRILLLCYSYTPALTPRAIRWSSIAEYWVEQGHHVDVVCSKMPGVVRDDNIKGVGIWEVNDFTANSIRRRLKTSGAQPKAPEKTDKNYKYTTKKVKHNNFFNQVKWVHDHTWKKLYWPDYVCTWYFPAARAVRKRLAENDYDVLISVSVPFTGHVVGYSVKKKNRNLSWVVDIGDPFCFMTNRPENNNRIYNKLNFAFERKVFDLAEAVSVTNEATSSKYMEIFPESSGKVRVIPPLLSTSPEFENEPAFFPDTDRTRLVFVGTLYSDIRKPDFLLKVFRKLLDTELSDKLELHFIGNIRESHTILYDYRNLLGKKIFIHGLVDRRKAIQAMREADVLVNMGNDTVYQLPSKVVEYMATGKPIINFSGISDDSSATFLRKYPGTLCLVENEVDIDAALCSRIIKFIHGSKNDEPVPDSNKLEIFEIDAVAGAYQELIEKSLPGSQRRSPKNIMI